MQTRACLHIAATFGAVMVTAGGALMANRGDPSATSWGAADVLPDGATHRRHRRPALLGRVLEIGEPVIDEVSPQASTPGWDLVSVECDDASSSSVSLGSLVDRSATFRIDPGETVTCEFAFSDTGTGPDPDATDPADDAPQRLLPLPGAWIAKNVSGEMQCGGRLFLAGIVLGYIGSPNTGCFTRGEWRRHSDLDRGPAVYETG